MRIDNLLKDALKEGASDFHLVSGLSPTIRVDGVLKQLGSGTASREDIEAMVKGILSADRFKRFVEKKELDFSHQISTGDRFRVNIHWEKGNIGLSARAIPAEIPTMEEIAMPEIVYDLCNLDRGLVIVTGPTGCGKSTSLAAMVDYINQNKKSNIITLEDPIEFIFKPKESLIRQRQLGTDMLSFKDGLVHALRQDPNVIMVGEMRDLETIAATITLAETGHLVFATLHTYSAAQTVDRIIDIFPPHQQEQIRMQLSITLKSVIAQRLLPKESGGRVAAREIMINTPAIANLIRENKVTQIKSTIQTSAKENMITMENSLKNLHKKGLISKEILKANMPANSRNMEDF